MILELGIDSVGESADLVAMDDHGGGGGSGGASELSLEELMDEYYSRPPQIAEWLWCIEYVAKFVKDLRCILGSLNLNLALWLLFIVRRSI